MLLRQVDRWLGFTKRLDRILPDRRNPLLIQHSQESLLRQRIYGLALGYEDLNDHDSLRHDVLWQTATDRAEQLGSCSTLCRLENRAGRKEAWLIHQVLFEQFVKSFSAPPKELTRKTHKKASKAASIFCKFFLFKELNFTKRTPLR